MKSVIFCMDLNIGVFSRLILKSWNLSTTDPQKTFSLCSGSTRYPTRRSSLKPRFIINFMTSSWTLCWLGHILSIDQNLTPNLTLENSLQTNIIKQQKLRKTYLYIVKNTNRQAWHESGTNTPWRQWEKLDTVISTFRFS